MTIESTGKKFEDLVVWQKAKVLTLRLYSILEDSKDFSFKSQILRASTSVMNNIAEGNERRTNNEFKYFLFVAKGSSGEVRSMLYLLKELNYVDEDEFNEIYNMSVEISKMLAGLIKTL